MQHKALTTGNRPPAIRGHFTSAHDDGCDEVEIKFLVPENPPGHVDLSVFSKIESFLADRDLIRSVQSKWLISRQLDTEDRRLEKNGATLRSRAECNGPDLRNANMPDYCLKLAGQTDESGALRRREFETPATNFKRICLDSLRKAFPASAFPEVHAALKGIDSRDVREFFQVQCERRRILIEIPHTLTGLSPDKKVIGELQLDHNVYVVPVKGGEKPIIIGRDLEIEMELMKEPCAYDKSPDRHIHVCSPLTPHEEHIAMETAKKLIQEASGNVLLTNDTSKGQRGFLYFDREADFRNHLVPNTPRVPEMRRVQPAFAVAADCQKKLHDLITRAYGPLLKTGVVRIASFNAR